MCLTSLSRNIYIYPTVSPELWGFLLRLSCFDTRIYKGSWILGGAPCFLQVLVTLGSYEGRSEVVGTLIFLIIFCLNLIPAISLLWCFNCLRIANVCQYLSSYFLSISTYLKTWLQFFPTQWRGISLILLKKSCTSWYGESSVVQDFFHHQKYLYICIYIYIV